ncbi:hypothetical protein RHMOL_Rhmol04G0071300 [Rhododendron molle]|uniref:Uncharacterized protein n=1 Tax=Rhododendron molle TaxID=49168 RepID=A0ACC0NZM2_RHOML|nr:hypothetical protein RHMOL_Rhmol04G0071300 [Rhododendron molle]
METAVEIANKVGVADIIGRIVDNLKDDSEPYKRMVMESIEKVVANLGASDIDARLEELLIDGILYALLSHYPLTNKIVATKLQENCIDLVDCIADRSAELVPAREWTRICFELLEGTINTFGYIAETIVPQHVLVTLLNNLEVQERQNCVCTTVGIAIVGETCSPFTILPALMNEYQVLELNVQNGVLKLFSFLFEYIGEMGKDYIYAVIPFLRHAFVDRDLIDRQTVASTVKHMILGLAGFGCENALIYWLNYVWPNILGHPHTLVAAYPVLKDEKSCEVFPHLSSLVEIIEHGLNDENQKVRTTTALSLAALAEAAAPYGIESFDSVFKLIRSHREKVLAALLKAIGFIVPLMNLMYADFHTKEVMFILNHEFQSPDKEIKKIVLKVVKQCMSTETVEADYIRSDILPDFFKNFWIRRIALDRRNYRELVETTVEIANEVGVAHIIGRIVDDLNDDSEPYSRMVMETIERVVGNLRASDIDAQLEELLIDGIFYAFQEHTNDDTNVMLNGFDAVVNALQ